MTLTKEQRAAIEERASKAVIYDLASAQTKIQDVIECPLCEGDGEVERALFENVEAVPVSIEIYGIGAYFGPLEDFYNNARQDIFALLQALREAEEQRDQALDQVAAAVDIILEFNDCIPMPDIIPCFCGHYDDEPKCTVALGNQDPGKHGEICTKVRLFLADLQPTAQAHTATDAAEGGADA